MFRRGKEVPEENRRAKKPQAFDAILVVLRTLFMTIKELNSALVISKKLFRLKSKLSDLRLTGQTRTKVMRDTPVQGGEWADPGQITLELSQLIEELQGELILCQEKISGEIAKADLSDEERAALMHRYVKCRSWRQTAYLMGYSLSRVFDYHASALKKFGADRSPRDLK